MTEPKDDDATLILDPELPKHAAADADYVCQIGMPSMGFRGLDATLMLAITYYEPQIRRMAQG